MTGTRLTDRQASFVSTIARVFPFEDCMRAEALLDTAVRRGSDYTVSPEVYSTIRKHLDEWGSITREVLGRAQPLSPKAKEALKRLRSMKQEQARQEREEQRAREIIERRKYLRKHGRRCPSKTCPYCGGAEVYALHELGYDSEGLSYIKYRCVHCAWEGRSWLPSDEYEY